MLPGDQKGVWLPAVLTQAVMTVLDQLNVWTVLDPLNMNSVLDQCRALCGQWEGLQLSSSSLPGLSFSLSILQGSLLADK